MEQKWYALAVQPRKEDTVELRLRSSGFDAVCPRYKKVVRHARKTQNVSAPFFPGYLFVRLDLGLQNWRQAHSVRGSIGLVKFGNRPSQLTQSFVDQFITSLSEDGMVNFDQNLKIGDRVRAVGGLFDQHTGEVICFTESDRVKILMEALNRKVATTLPRTDVVVAA